MTGRVLLDPLRTTELVTGLCWGIAALAGGLLAAAAWRAAGRHGPVPAAGLLLAAAAVAGLAGAVAVPAGLVLGLVALAVAGVVAGVASLPGPSMAILALPGALLLAAEGGPGLSGWMRVVVAVTAVVGAVALFDFDTRWTGAAPALLVVTAAGIYATVPDTEQALVLLGASIPLALLGWPLRAAALGRAGACAAAGLMAWTAGAGGHGRGGAVVGAVACLGLLVAEPAGVALLGRRRRAAPARNAPGRLAPGPKAAEVALAGAAHLAAVAAASRIAGLQRSPLAAAALALPVLALAAACGARSSSGSRQEEPGATSR